MSNKEYPEVKGYCPAGCARRVPSYEEYQDTLIRIVDKDGNPIKEVVFEIDEEAGTMNMKLVPAPTETPTE